MSKELIRDLYNEFASDYHAKRLSVNRNFYNYFVEIPAISCLLRSIVRGKKVLDIGCGTGILTGKIKEWAGNVTGADISSAMIEIAKRENPGIEFHVLDAERTDFANTEFDIVTSSLMIHYFDDLSPLFKEINRILKTNGLFIFSFHHPFNETLNKIDINGESRNMVDDYFTMRSYTWRMLENMELVSYHHTFEYISGTLSDNGFLIDKIKEPRPIDEGKSINEREYNYLKRIPSFCVIKAVKHS